VSYSFFIVVQDVEVTTLSFSPSIVRLRLKHLPTNLTVESVGKSKHKLKDKMMMQLDKKVRAEYCG